MLNPGVYEVDKTITTNMDGNDAAHVSTPQENLEGMLAATAQVRWQPQGGAGGSGKAFLQTSLDKGQTWIDIWCHAFTDVASFKIVNLSKLTPITTSYTPTDGTLADNTVKDGILGDRLRWKFTSTGTAFSAGSVASCRAVYS